MVRQDKKDDVEFIVNKISNAKTVAVVDLHSLPARQLHSVRKKLKGKADFIVKKTSLIKRALKKTGKTQIIDLIESEKAIVISDLDAFSLYKQLCSGPLKVNAKPGQVAPSDIVVPAGETTLPPGPALSEFKQAGLDARIQAGKIVIAKDGIVAKKGEKISPIVAGVLQKLGIKPFELKVNVPAILKGDLLYQKDVLDINEEEFMKDVAIAASSAFNLSVEIAYPTSQNISRLLGKAHLESKALAVEIGFITPETLSAILGKAMREANALKAKVPE
jgi:large subunit ribosomal protein L10